MKFAAGVLLFGAWLGLVLARLAPPQPLVDAIGYALVGLGIYHAAAANGQLTLKFLSGLMLFGAWLTLVVMHLAQPAGLIDAIGYTLAGLGIYQAKGPALKPIVTGLLGGTTVAASPTASSETAVGLSGIVVAESAAPAVVASAPPAVPAPQAEVVAPTATVPPIMAQPPVAVQ
ncbi:hypothetical protein WM15_29845 [Burkholderia ubonensis]|nr:hypothetical protein WM15_29845 [Burkholderia ubonensis]